MIKLLKSALWTKANALLIIVTLVAMLGVTVSSQLEIFSIGILTKKGPDFFEVFAPIEDHKLGYADEVSFKEVESRFPHLVDSQTNVATKTSVSSWLFEQKKEDFFSKGYHFFDQFFAYTKDYRFLAFLILAVALFRAITLFLHRLTTKILAISVSQKLRETYFSHIQTLPLEFYHKYHIGSLSSRVVGDAAMISEAINSLLTNYIQTPFTVISTLLLCFFTSWKLSLIIFFGFPLIVFPILFLAKRIKRIAKALQKNHETFTSVLIDYLSGIQTIKLFGGEAFSMQKYQEQNQEMARLERKSARYATSSRPIIHTIGMGFLGFALMWGLYVLDLSVSEVLVYCGFLYIFYEPIKKFAEENANIQKGIAAAERMQEVLEVKPSIVDKEGAVEKKHFEQKIQFDRVWFRYEQEWVLKDFSLEIKRGETVALVGATGAGKSTVAQLLPRLYEVEKGEITIDGISIQSLRQKDLRALMSFVPQKPYLFQDTLYANLSFGAAYSSEAIKKACKRAYAEEFIERLPGGYEAFVQDGGKNFSGGQQQRLALARALLRPAPILILDEATSSLDTVSEEYIKRSLQELRGQITLLVIAHRLSTIEGADKIVVLDQGRVESVGTKQELLQTSPLFQTLWKLHQTS